MGRPSHSDEERVVGAHVVRPSIPPLAWIAIGLIAGILLAEELAWRRLSSGTSGGLWAGAAIGIGVLVVAVTLWRTRTRGGRLPVSLLAAAALAGCVLGIAWSQSWVATCGDLKSVRASSWRVETLGDPTSGKFGASSRVRIVDRRLPKPVRGAELLALWPDTGTLPEAGVVADVRGTLTIRDPANDPRARDLLRGNACGTLRVRRIAEMRRARTLRGFVGPLREWARRCTATVKGAGGDLLDGIVLGDRRRLAGSAAETAFKTTGLTHLVAVSGSHLVVVAACVAVLAGALGVRRGWRALVVAGITGLYVLFSGVQVSAVRAWMMAVVVVASGLTGRRSDSVGALALTVLVMVIATPSAVFDIGFQLSALSVVGLLLLARLGAAWFSAALPRRLEPLGSAVSMTLVAQAATLPVTARVFAQVSLVAPMANVLVGPMVSAALVMGLVGLCLSWPIPVLGEWVLGVTGVLLDFAARVAEALSRLPSAAVPATPAVVLVLSAAAAAAIALWALWPRPSSSRQARRAIVLLTSASLILTLGPPLSREPVLSVLDVGQGDSILVRDGSAALLVDTGPSGAEMKSAIARTGVKRVEAVILTHPHDDHTGGLQGLAEVVRIGTIYQAAGPAANPKPTARGSRNARATGGQDAMTGSLAAGDRLALGRWTLDVLWPRRVRPKGDSANDDSVVLLARCGSFEVILTGDAENEVLDELAKEGSLRDIEVLKVGHHGSKIALGDRVLNVLKPEYAVVSVGSGNRFGHPAPGTLALLEEHGTGVLRTDIDGDVTIRVAGQGFTIDTGR